MKINNYIQINTNKVYNNKEFRLYYDGYLTEVSNNEPIKLRYGDQNWNNIQNIEMKKDQNNRLYADIKLNNFDKLNFCFEYNNVWDNNFSNNYSLDISKFNLNNYENNINELEENLSDNFLYTYNLNKKEAKDIPPITSESIIFENASNVNTLDTNSEQLKQLKETLNNLFPKDNNEEELSKKFDTSLSKQSENIPSEQELLEQELSKRFDELFARQNEDADNFIEIKYNFEDLEVYTPITPYRTKLLAILAQRELNSITNIVLEDDKVRLTSKIPYINTFRKLAKQNELQQILRLGNEEEAQFLVVSPYSELDIYDNSFIGTIKRYAAYVSKSIKKIYYYLKENLSTDEIK